MLKTQSKTIKRTVAIECYTNRKGWKTLYEIESAYKKMLVEMIGFAIKNDSTQKFFTTLFTSNIVKSFLGWQHV